MTPAQVQSLIDYYSNLLIIQYNNKPKAKATIQLLIETVLASGVFLDVLNGYDLDTAVGVQLDVIGKYVGVDRFYQVSDLTNFFAYTYYSDVTPDTQDKFGFTDYADYGTFQYNGVLNYGSVLSDSNTLSDDDFRTIIRLKILQNNINHSHKSIDQSIYEIFGLSVIPDKIATMQMVYFISANLTAVINAALAKGLLPKPIGVGLWLIPNVSKPFFGFATYAHTPGNITGFTTYAGYATNNGEVLTYDGIVT